VQRELGSGSFAVVKLAKLEGRSVAVKILRTGSSKDEGS
jgi:hypothetical protein